MIFRKNWLQVLCVAIEKWLPQNTQTITHTQKFKLTGKNANYDWNNKLHALFKAYDKVTGADYKISNLILIFEEKHIKSSFF